MDASMEESGSVSADDEVPNEFSPESLTSSESGWQGWHHPEAIPKFQSMIKCFQTAVFGFNTQAREDGENVVVCCCVLIVKNACKGWGR